MEHFLNLWKLEIYFNQNPYSSLTFLHAAYIMFYLFLHYFLMRLEKKKKETESY